MKTGRFQFFKKNFQVIYSIALIIFIPLAIVINTLVIRSTFEKNIEQESYRNITSIGEAINAGIWETIDSSDKAQEKLAEIAKFNTDIIAIDLLRREEDDKFIITASLDSAMIGKTTDDMQDFFAWREGKPIAFLTHSSTPNTINQPIDESRSGVRYRVLTKPLISPDGEKLALLSMKVSLEQTDALSQRALWRSVVLLSFTVLIIILLLINNTRLFEYATLYRKLKEVDEMKDEFISMASHELRTPVTGIRGYVSLVLDGTYGPISDKVKDSLKMVSDASARLATLVEDLLNVSRIEQGRIQMERKLIDIRPVVDSVVSELKIQADQKSLALSTKTAEGDFPSTNLDSDRLKQILINLIGNAIKYTVQGSVEVMVEYKKEDKQVVIKIKDTGIGMSAKARERLFEKFYRVQDEKTKNISGTGLGLWITKQLIELQDGKIAVDSIENVGTQVSVMFPEAKEE